MKKSKTYFTYLLLITLVFAVLVFAFCICSVTLSDHTSRFEASDEVLDKISSGAPGTGEYSMFAFPIALLSDIVSSIAYAAFAVLLPGTAVFLAFALQCAARLFMMGEFKKWKFVTATVISCVVIFIFAVVLSGIAALNIISNPVVGTVYMALALAASVACAVVNIVMLVKIKKNSCEEFSQNSEIIQNSRFFV